MIGAPFFLERSEEPRTAEDVASALVCGGVAPDASVGWARRGPTGWERGVGHASARPELLEDEPIFDLASLTKPMTALSLARSGLRFDTAIGEVLDEARSSPTERAPLELLLAHRAGLEAHLPLYAPLLAGEPVDRGAALRAAALARRADASGPIPLGGCAPVYSDLGFILVGEALARKERARDAGEVVEHLVAHALGRDDELGTARSLSSRGVDFARRVRPTEVVAWRGGEVRGRVHDENAWALTGEGGSGHAGMFGTASAVLAFGCAVHDAVSHGEGPLWTPGRPRPEWLIRARPGGTLRAGFDGRSETGSSAGARAGARTYGHLGFTGTSLWIDPDACIVVVVLTNRVCPTRENRAIRAARPAAHDALFEIARRRSGAPLGR